MDNVNGIFGRFLMDEPAGYEMNSLDMETSWEYIYQNRDILLRLDQFGPVNAQLHPPGDILLFKREKDDKFSKWLVWLQADEINEGQPFTNFFRPVVHGTPRQTPENLKITFKPHEATYTYEYEGLWIRTRFFVPNRGPHIHMEFEATNNRPGPVVLNITPAMTPYVNPAQLAPWDKGEWYLKTGFGMEEEAIFWSRMLDSSSIKENRRTAILWSSRENLQGFEISLEKWMGAGDFYRPESAFCGKLRLTPEDCGRYGEETGTNQIYGYPPVYALRYRKEMQPGSHIVIQQVLSSPDNEPGCGLQSLENVRRPLCLFDRDTRAKELRDRKAFFDDLFHARSIHTSDSFLDHYVNTWLPLQMHWVASLDRGWPTGMRGVRDCANDFMGELYMQPKWARDMLLLLFECQKTDGWFPRQISAKGRRGKHDLREFVDGGAFVVEFLYEYLCVTGDFDLLRENLPWLDSDRPAPVIEHAVAAVGYYLREENIGIHGLCKIRGGDWLDAVNRAGLEGKGESVMVTSQVIMAVTFLNRIAEDINGKLYDMDLWRQKQEEFGRAIRKHAYNKQGFFNGVYTDAGQWIFSDRDPDGESRPYICANAYAILSGAADCEMQRSALRVMKGLLDDAGYKLFSPPIGRETIEKVGRSGSGDGLMGLFENAAPYNHGSHGFLGRCLASVGDKEELLEVLKYMLPFDMEKHPTPQAMTPPYAVVNCWQKIPLFPNRGGMVFLTGTISMALRMVYNWMLGIRPELNGLVIDPCCSSKLGDVKVRFSVREKNLTLSIRQNGSQLYLDGKRVSTRMKDLFTEREVYYILYEELYSGSVLEMGCL